MATHSMPGKSRWQRSLVGYRPWDRKESDTQSCLSTQTRNLKSTESRNLIYKLCWFSSHYYICCLSMYFTHMYMYFYLWISPSSDLPLHYFYLWYYAMPMFPFLNPLLDREICETKTHWYNSVPPVSDSVQKRAAKLSCRTEMPLKSSDLRRRKWNSSFLTGFWCGEGGGVPNCRFLS